MKSYLKIALKFRLNHNTRYFEDIYQGMPSEGYTNV